MTYYMIEIREPTNCPGDVVTAYVYRSERKAKKVFREIFPPEDEWDIGEPNEWEDYYKNGKVLEIASNECEECYGRLIELNNKGA